MNRKITREELMKFFYAIEINNEIENADIHKYISDAPSLLDKQYFIDTYKNFLDNRIRIDKIINEHSSFWKINRIAKVDLAILRIAITELLYDETIPDSVSVNEAVEISKKYSNFDSHKFINGILGSIIRDDEVI